MSQGLENRARQGRVGASMGVAFVVLFVVGFIVFSTPTNNKDTAKWQGWWADSGHRTAAIIGAYLMVLAALAFVGFIWSLRRRVPDSGGLMITFGSLFAAVVMVSTMVRATIPGSKQFGSTPLPAGALAADFARQFDQIGFGLLLVAGALTAGAFTAVASHSARRHAILPGWLTMAGYVVAVLQLAGALFLPFVVFVLWVLVVSIVLLRHDARVDTRVP
jgi:hypothetical protein